MWIQIFVVSCSFWYFSVFHVFLRCIICIDNFYQKSRGIFFQSYITLRNLKHFLIRYNFCLISLYLLFGMKFIFKCGKTASDLSSLHLVDHHSMVKLILYWRNKLHVICQYDPMSISHFALLETREKKKPIYTLIQRGEQIYNPNASNT